ncbi:CAP domain-containing protein [Melampsora americana]|nr:CAP domain-containing protein [Melampsora americana]
MIIKVTSHLVGIIIMTYLTWLCSGLDNQADYESEDYSTTIAGELLSSRLSPSTGTKLLSRTSNQEPSNSRDQGGPDDQGVDINGFVNSDDHIKNSDLSRLQQEPGTTSDTLVRETLKNTAEVQMTLDNDPQLESTSSDSNYPTQGDMSDDKIAEDADANLLRRKESTASHIWVKWHNFHRKKFAAPDLSWDQNLANRAQRFTNRCNFQHSKPTKNGPHYGENLYTGASDVRGMVNAWVTGPNEADIYDPRAPTYSHFTQVVWRGTTHVGCAISACKTVGHFAGSKVYQKMGKKALLSACVYYP